MPAHYFEWTVRGGNTVKIDVGFQQSLCRDSSYHFLTRALFDTFIRKARRGMYSDSSGVDWQFEKACYAKWAFEHGNKLTYTGLYTDERSNNSIFGKDWFKLDALPHIIQILTPLFPSVSLTPVYDKRDDFKGVTVHGIAMSGDTEIIPAFYWVGMLQRQALNKGPSVVFSADGTFNYKMMDYSHVNEWERLTNGIACSGSHQLAAMYGPISSAHNTFKNHYEQSLELIQKHLAGYQGRYKDILADMPSIVL